MPHFVLATRVEVTFLGQGAGDQRMPGLCDDPFDDTVTEFFPVGV